MPIKEAVTLQETIDFLNEILEIDREAITDIFYTIRTPHSV